MPTRYPKGSEWRRWDLHIHTPASALNHEFESWESYLNALEAANPQICALGITDYASIEGYRRIYKEKFENGRLPNFDLIVPNIEFRISPLTKHGSAINLHILVDPSAPEHIERIEDALSRFTFEYKSQKYPCTHKRLADLGKAFNPGIKDEQAAFKEGVNQFKKRTITLLERGTKLSLG